MRSRHCSPILLIPVFTFLALFLPPSISLGEEIHLGAAKDNTLFEEGEFSNGAGNYLFAGKTGVFAGFVTRRAMIAFDLSSTIPKDAIITAVSLTLYLSRTPENALVETMFLYPLLADWGEGTSKAGGAEGAGAPASAGDATWNRRFYGDPTSTWSVGGGDFTPTASAATDVGALATETPVAYTWSGQAMVADVQSWLNTPESNFGWILIGNEDADRGAKRFNSSENPDVNLRPALSVTYTVVPEPATATIILTGALLLLRRRRPARIAAGLLSYLVLTSPFLLAQGPIPEPIAMGSIQIELAPIATGLTAPNLLISAPDGTDRQFITDQDGQIFIIENGTLLNSPFLDVASYLASLNRGYDERGLLGMAFDPGFSDPESNGFGRVFTYTSEPVSDTADLTDPYATILNHQSVLTSWKVDPLDRNRVDPTSRQVLLRVDQPQANHNGGTIAFGPDDYLYIGLGDGGGSNDNNANGHNSSIGNGQDANIALGKILRIDVNGTNSANGQYGIPTDNPYAEGGGLKEIYASGFRNPYRFSFDGNRLLVADVGQNQIEELNDVVLGGNYGWRYKEGSFKFNPDNSQVSTDLSGLPEGLIDPIFEYDHDEGISIVGGYVYRGTLIPELVGKYVFGDFGLSFAIPSGRLFYADLETAEILEFKLGADDEPLGFFIKGLGQDSEGELYVLGGAGLGPSGTTGVAMKLVPEPSGSLTLCIAGMLLGCRRMRSRV